MSGSSQLHWDVPPAAELVLEALQQKLCSKSVLYYLCHFSGDNKFQQMNPVTRDLTCIYM